MGATAAVCRKRAGFSATGRPCRTTDLSETVGHSEEALSAYYGERDVYLLRCLERCPKATAA